MLAGLLACGDVDFGVQALPAQSGAAGAETGGATCGIRWSSAA
jgi:hypothetical protein